jgi:hypothetical protein
MSASAWGGDGAHPFGEGDNGVGAMGRERTRRHSGLASPDGGALGSWSQGLIHSVRAMTE